jgi:DNA-binding SARP family transcriptional activator
MRINLLGTVELLDGGTSVPIGSRKRRMVFAALARRAGTTVSFADLVDAIWSDAPPRSAACNLRTYVSDLRRLVGERHIVRDGSGYRLLADVADIDVTAFIGLAERGDAALSAGDVGLARRELSTALDLWRGEPFADLGDVTAFAGTAQRLRERHLRVLEQRIDIDLRLNRAGALVAELTELVAEHPYHERFCHQLMLALHRCGRQADALRAFQAASAVLREDLGVEPGTELQTTHWNLLNHRRFQTTASR